MSDERSPELWAELRYTFGQGMSGYIPHSALAELGIRLGPGATWFTAEQVEAIKRHPRWEPAAASRSGGAA